MDSINRFTRILRTDFWIIVMILAFVPFCSSQQEEFFRLQTEHVHIYELFSKKLIPELFNWTSHGISEQFRYRPTLKNHPGLISWMSYSYSNERHAGFIYGTPTEKYVHKTIEIEVIALNRQSYETRRLIIPFFVNYKTAPKNEIQMKIDNLNWVHMMDAGRIENLKNIFRKDLWPESRHDLELSFMESAVKMGGRLPLQPQQREGVYVNIGSKSKYSQRLTELHEEIKPLYKISSCTYKRTSVQYLFENAGFKIDWCAFKFLSEDSVPENVPTSEEELDQKPLDKQERWIAPTIDQLPERNYSDEISISIAIPAVLFALLVAILTVVLCFHHEKLPEPKHEPTVQMVQYSGSNNATTTTTLKSLHEASNHDNELLSSRSQSPSNSLYRSEGSPRTCTLRPKPPSYPKYGGPSGYDNGTDNI